MATIEIAPRGNEGRASALRRPGLVAAAVAGVAVVAACALLRLAARPAVDGPIVDGFTMSLILLLALAALVVVVLRPDQRASASLVVVLASLALGAGALMVLRGSPFPPNGIGGDEAFRIASIARASEHLVPVDFAYRGLPAFYPPLYFAVLGRLVAVFGISAVAAAKLGVALVAFGVPLLSYILWKRVVLDVVAAAAVAVAMIAVQNWTEPYAWIAVVAFVPWWLYCIEQRGRRGAPSMTPRQLVVASLIGGALLMTYYYYFFVGGAALIVVALAAIARARSLRAVPYGRNTVLVLLGTAIVSALYWVPLAVSIVTTPGAESLQNRYFDRTMIPIPTPFLHLTLPGLVMLFGLGFLLATCRTLAVSRQLLTLVGAAYLWFVLGYVAILLDHPIIAVRVVPLIECALAAGAGLGVVHVARWLQAREAGRASPVLPVLAVAVSVALVALSLASIPAVPTQRATKVPHAFLAGFDRATAALPKDATILTSDWRVVDFRPLTVFNVWNAHYAHPAGTFHDRTSFLRSLAAERNSRRFAAALRDNPYDAVDAVLLDREHGRLRYKYWEDNFPRGTVLRTIDFDESQFSPEYFERHRLGHQELFVMRSR
jgi:hypothetical protein